MIVATGATIVDMDFFEALGFRHYRGTSAADDKGLRELYIDRIYDTYIDEEQPQICDNTIQEIADGLKPRPYSSREFIQEMGKYLMTHGKKNDSLVRVAYERDVPKNFAQDTVVCAEVLGRRVDMHKYAVQIAVADVRDGACSSSTLKEASSWGKVDTTYEQMVFAEATSILPLIASCAFHGRLWEDRAQRRWSKIFEPVPAGESQ